ncbi:MAG: invasion associated locus B family protein [Pseudomonadota bacterium]
MRKALALGLLIAASPLAAKDSLGVYSEWAAFRDAEVPRCYAIAESGGRSSVKGYASVGTWPSRKVRGQVHIRLSRAVRENARVRLAIGTRRFNLIAQGQDAWGEDKAMDAAIIAAMRSATRMSVSATASNGRRFTDRYALEGAATAMDASLVGCARQG